MPKLVDARKLTPSQRDQIVTLNTVERRMRQLIEALPNSREKSLALTKLDELGMWALRAVVANSEEENS